MRRRLIEALTYPRLFVLDNVCLEDCPHDGLFDSTCERCLNCNSRQECHWLKCIDSFSDFARMPTYTMHASLLYGMSLIEERNSQVQHDADACSCESCTWVRNARQLAREFQMSCTGNQYDPDRAASNV